MPLIISIFILIITSCGLFVVSGRRLIHPVRIYVLITGLLNIPYAIYVYLDKAEYQTDFIKWFHLGAEKHYISKAVLYLAISQVFFCIGYKIIGSKKKLPLRRLLSKADYYMKLDVIFLLFGLGVIAFISQLADIGGLSGMVSNIAHRTEMIRGKGAFIGPAVQILTYTSLAAIYCSWREANSLKRILSYCMLLGAILILASMGGRKPVIVLMLFAAILYYLRYGRGRGFQMKYAFAALTVVVYFVFGLAIRTPGVMTSDGIDRQAFNAALEDAASEGLANASYLETYAFMIHYFESNEHWRGRQFLAFFNSFSSSKTNALKPPVDEGVYVRSLAAGQIVKLGMPADDLYKSSWPPETLGTGISIAGPFGAAVLAALFGMIQRISWNSIKGKHYFFPLMIFLHFAILFQITVLRMVQLTIFLGAIGLIIGCILFREYFLRGISSQSKKINP